MLNAADILILAVLLLSVLLGLWRGFVSEVLALVCWGAAFWVAWLAGRRVAALYAPWLPQPAANLAAGYLTCFLGVLIVGALVGWAVRRLLSHGGLRGADRAFGMLFGLVRGLLVVTLAVLVLGFTALPATAAWWRQSVLLPSFEPGAHWMVQTLAPGMAQHFEAGPGAVPEAPQAAVRQAAQRLLRPTAAGTLGLPPAARSRVFEHGPRRNDVGQ